jgi:predicted Zn-dependent protease
VTTNGVEMNDESEVDTATPRRGFFRGPVFLHPDMKFQYRFPNGWSTWNAGDAVIGLSAAQDAIIKLRIAAGTLPEAAETFFGQPGLAADRISGTAINGLPATTGEFITETGQGTVRGIATFIAHGGATYEVMASTTSHEFESYISAFKRSITTFNHLNGLGVEAVAAGATHPYQGRAMP